ncbi:MAG: formyltransferase family protein [Ruthenibacterium lactatiformans]
MNILFMGTPDIAAAALEAILDAGHTVCGVYTRADKPVGRKQVLTAPPVKRTAMAHGIPVFQPGTLRDAAQAENIRALAPELIVVVAYGRILPPEVRDPPIRLHQSARFTASQIPGRCARAVGCYQRRKDDRRFHYVFK